MPNEIKGLENSIPIRMVYTDTMEEVLFKSAAVPFSHARETFDSDKNLEVMRCLMADRLNQPS
jgi:hypothetical protein